MFEDPFVGDDASVVWSRHESPGLVSLQRIKFSFHGSIPVGVLDCVADALGDRGDGRRGHHGVLRVGFVDAISGMGDHRVMGRRNVVRRRRGDGRRRWCCCTADRG